MKVGRMRDRVAIQKLSGTKNELGQPDESWVAYVSRFAEITPLDAKEKAESGAELSESMIKVRLRYDSETKLIDHAYRVVFGGVNYELSGDPVNVFNRNRDLILTCKAQR